MTIETTGHDGQRYGPHAGLCLEAQHLPDSLHHPGLAEHRPIAEAFYVQRLEVEIGR